jgi:hypothetical protein
MRQRTKRKVVVLLAGLIALAACGQRSRDPDALSAEENRQLDNASHMLDVPDDDTDNREAALGNGEDAGSAAAADSANSQ